MARRGSDVTLHYDCLPEVVKSFNKDLSTLMSTSERAATLKSLSLSCKSLRPYAQAILFRRLRLEPLGVVSAGGDYIRLREVDARFSTLQARPDILRLVR